MPQGSGPMGYEVILTFQPPSKSGGVGNSAMAIELSKLSAALMWPYVTFNTHMNM